MFVLLDLDDFIQDQPTELHLSLGDTCNQKCIICNPKNSTLIQKEWKENKKQADIFCSTGDCGATGDNVTKARLIMNSNGTDQEIWSILNGNKTQRFFKNLL